MESETRRQKKEAVKSFAEKLKSKTEPADYFYSNLYTNQAATSIELDDEEVASGILKRRRERQQIAELHGGTPPSNKDSALVNLVKVMNALLKIESRKLSLEMAKVEKGQVFGYSFTISTTAAVHLDFIDSLNENLPAGAIFNGPGSALFGITIWNDTGADIGFTINRELREGSDRVVLKAGDSATIAFEEAKIEKLNLAIIPSTGTSSAVRIMGVL